VKARRLVATLALTCVAAPAIAGPPYDTNDPAPTDMGHWEIYLFTDAGGSGPAVDADSGVELNYGPVKNLQVSAALPLHFAHDAAGGWRSGVGDFETGIKYRFINDARSGFSAAVFPKAILPTSSLGSHQRARFFFPLWAGKDFARGTSVFGGGGYMVNPGSGNRDYWTGGMAITHQVTSRFQIGAEANRQGSDSVGGHGSTSAGIGAILDLRGPFRLLASAGPTRTDGGGNGFHAYAALGLDF